MLRGEDTECITVGADPGGGRDVERLPEWLMSEHLTFTSRSSAQHCADLAELRAWKQMQCY